MSLPFNSSLSILSSLLILCLFPITSTFATETNNSTKLDRYQQALKVDPDNPTLHYILGLAQLKNGNNDAAIASFRTAYPSYTESIEMQLNMGMAYTQIGDTDSALLYLEQAESLGALKTQNSYQLINTYYKVGLIYLEQELFSEASLLFQRVLDLDQTRVEIYRLLGDIAAKNGQREVAISHFTKYLEFHPEDQAANEYLYSLHFNYANQLMEKGDFIAAQSAFEAARAIVPESPLILYSLGSLAYNAEDTKQAIQNLTTAYATAPEELKENIRAMLYNSALKSLNGQHLDQALDGITPLIKDSDSAIKYLLLAGEIHLERHEFTTAREIYNRILSRDPTHPQAIINIAVAEENAVEELFQEGLIAYKKRQYIRALALFDEVLTLQPGERRSSGYRKKTEQKISKKAKSLFQNARKALTAKDYINAVTLAKEGLELTPNSTNGLRLKREAIQVLKADINQLIANGFELLEQSDFLAAEAQFNKILEIDPDNIKANQGKRKSEQYRQTNARVEIKAGNVSLEDGDIKGAGEHFTRAEKLIPNLPETIEGRVRLDAIISSLVAQELQLGRGARSAGNLNQAEAHFNSALKFKDTIEIRNELKSIVLARTNRAEELLQSAQTARREKKYKTALNIYNRILTINPQHPAKKELITLRSEMNVALSGNLDKARQKSELGDFKAALSFYRQALDLEPTNKEALRGLKNGRNKIGVEVNNNLQRGRDAFNSGDLEAAKDAFTAALKFDPYQAEAKSNLTKIASIEQTGIRPGDENKLYLQGIEFYTLGKYSEAIKAWENVIKLVPEHTKAKMNIKKAKRKLQSIREFNSG